MRRLPLVLVLGLILATAASAQDKFSDRLTSEEREAAGLNQLTPAQLDKLNELVRRDRSGSTAPAAAEVAPANAPASAPAVASAPPPAPAATTEMTPAAVSTTPAAAAEERSEKPARRRWFGLPARDEANSISGTLDGEFKGWTGTTMFRLKDGQIWVQEDKTDYRQVTPMLNPRITITKSMFGGYKLTVEGLAGWVRVRRVQ